MKKLMVLGVSIAVLVCILTGGAVVFASAKPPVDQTVTVSNADRPGTVDLQALAKRLLWTQDQTKVASFLRQMVRDGKLTVLQAKRIMNFWQKNHTSVARPAPQTVR